MLHSVWSAERDNDQPKMTLPCGVCVALLTAGGWDISVDVGCDRHGMCPRGPNRWEWHEERRNRLMEDLNDALEACSWAVDLHGPSDVEVTPVLEAEEEQAECWNRMTLRRLWFWVVMGCANLGVLIVCRHVLHWW